MTEFTRYAIYYLPPDPALARFGANWLGWDVNTGAETTDPALTELVPEQASITARPRKYGFHATLKAPFRLAEGQSPQALIAAVSDFAAAEAPVIAGGLALSAMGSFLALRPSGDVAALNALVGRIVTTFDPFRAPAPKAELDRRRAAGLSPAQEQNLTRWGYPYVLDEFRFHMTLSGPLNAAEQSQTCAALAPVLAPLLEPRFALSQIAIAGEGPDGRFRTLCRADLTG